jgi:tetratricopeptide (TPR) repeat protein
MEPDDLHEDPLQDYSGSVWTTWEISYQAIRQKHEKTANLLLLWSYLDNKDMWHGLFARACKRGDHVVGMLSKWIGNIASSEIRFGRAMRLLRDYSLVEEVVESNSHATHPVVHQWARHSQGRHFQSELSRLAVVIVGGGVPTRPVGDHFELQRRFLPHAQVCLRHILETKAFDCFEANGAFDKGVIQVAEQETLLRTMICLALLFTDQSKLTEANELYKRALKGAEMVLGRKHEMTLGIENNVAILYVDKGKLEEAEKMYNRVLLEREQILGSTHPRTIDTVGNLDSLYIRQGKLVEAEQMLKRALRGREKTYGPSHPSTLDAVGNLGMLNLNKGRLAEAAQMFELVLRGYEDVVGKEGIQQYTPALGTLENMAITYQEQGDIAKAKVTWERALSGYIDLLGPSDDKCKELLRWIEELSACQKDREETERKGGKEEEHEERQHEERKQQTKMTEERGQAAEETKEKEKEEHGNGEGAQITKERRGRKWVRKLAVLMKEGKKGHI